MTGKTIKISKLDAARRQLDCAIELWFRSGDPVSIQALIYNAHQIIQDVNEKRGNEQQGTVLGMVQRHVKPEHVEEVVKLWKKPMNFVKHADRDPDGILEFNPDLAEIEMVLCLVGLGLLGEQPSDVMRVLRLWHCLHKPELILDGANPVVRSFDANQIEDMRQVEKHEFLQIALQGIVKDRI